MEKGETYLTLEGLAKLEAELEHLRNVRRPEVAARIQRAKEIGGMVDNAEYDEAKNEQSFVEGRILTLEHLLKEAVVVRSAAAGGKVQVGSHVSVTRNGGPREEYTIVGSAEADPSQGKISNESPVGKALLGKRVGQEVVVNIPAGTIRLKIVRIK